MVVAAKSIDAVARQALRCLGARNTVVVLADAHAVTRAIDAFFLRIEVELDRAADAIRTLALFCDRTRHAGAGTGGVATDAVGALTRLAL